MSQYMNGMSSSRKLLGFGLPPSPSHVIAEVRKFCVQIVHVVIGPPSQGFHSIKWGSTFRWAILGWSVFGKSIMWICTNTGAKVTVIWEEAFLTIPRRDQPLRLKGEPTRVTSVDKEPQCKPGCYGVTFKIQGRVIKHDTLVVSGLCADAIIGCDIINRYHLSYDASKWHV